SAVLTAMKVPMDTAMGTVRFSTGRETTEEDIDRALEVIGAALRRMKPAEEGRFSSPVPGEEVKLTRYTHGLGCACKLRPQDLEKVLRDLPSPRDKNVIIGKDTADDAAVYLLGDNLAVVQTVDFFTPIVDDPFHFGAIAAANSLSDIYAMGARPLFGLNIVGFPLQRLSLEVLRRILEGALAKATEAEISIIGGHTIEDTEPKYGLAVTGVVDPARVISNAGARPGDWIILTKPLGTGIIATAMKRDIAGEEMKKRAIEVMSALNRDAAEAMEGFSVHACTDVTGFGLLGHLREMTGSSGVDAEIWHNRVPVIEGVEEMILAGAVPGGTLNNRDFVAPFTRFDSTLSEADQLILCDAQTSGGLLIALPEGEAVRLVEVMNLRGVRGVVIGRFRAEGRGSIEIVPEKI
ncbi:MAG: selenide, water dikinase SelD, partial [Candidatus Krumholzibacteriota bacterium]|nr:selenide, water dikinase SelD [Candidatus Krumholzibacteriota bacterium]